MFKLTGAELKAIVIISVAVSATFKLVGFVGTKLIEQRKPSTKIKHAAEDLVDAVKAA